jgi:hypothetical protein
LQPMKIEPEVVRTNQNGHISAPLGHK